MEVIGTMSPYPVVVRVTIAQYMQPAYLWLHVMFLNVSPDFEFSKIHECGSSSLFPTKSSVVKFSCLCVCVRVCVACYTSLSDGVEKAPKPVAKDQVEIHHAKNLHPSALEMLAKFHVHFEEPQWTTC
jgi:hypothetical protein